MHYFHSTGACSRSNYRTAEGRVPAAAAAATAVRGGARPAAAAAATTAGVRAAPTEGGPFSRRAQQKHPTIQEEHVLI